MGILYRFPLACAVFAVLVFLSTVVSKDDSGPQQIDINSWPLCGSQQCVLNGTSSIPTNQSLAWPTGFLTGIGDCKPIPPPPNVTDDDNIPLQQRLAEGVISMQETRLEIGADDKSIFLLGNTGTGKSTVTQIMAGNLSRIYASVTSSGDVVIFDEDDRIGPPTVRSKTLLPDYIAEQDTGLIFVDCPGFDDTRGTDMDIAAMYFLKHALESVNQAKFLFVIEYSAVKSGNDRLSFDLLITHATTLIPNPNEVKAAIGLTVNKVPRVNDFGQLRTREQLLTGFKDFMSAYVDVKKDELASAANDEDKEKLQRKIDLTEIFLSDLGDDQLPTRVSYVRSPENCGALDELPEMLETREMLEDLYTNSINYANVSPDKFRISLKSATLLIITNEHLPNTVDQIRNQTEFASKQLQETFLELFYDSMDSASPATPIFAGAVERLTTHLENIRQNGSDFANHLFEILTDLEMNSNDTERIINDIRELENQLAFFEMVSGFNISRPDPSWLVPLEQVQNRFGEYLEFYDFCEKLDLELGSHSRQVALDFLKRKGPNVTDFETDHVLEFLDNNSIVSVPSKIYTLFNSKMAEQDKQYLANLVKAQIPNPILSCEPSSLDGTLYRLKVAGRNVKLSDIVPGASTLPTPHDWPNACSNQSRVQQISVFAQDSVYFDTDMIFDCKQTHLSILATSWEVIGISKLQLGCYTVVSYNESAAPGAYGGSNGNDGKHGVPGIDGGTFFGILSESTNGDNLDINTDGGPGGTGQDGGTGGQGRQGQGKGYNDFPSAAYCNSIGACGDAKKGKIINGNGDMQIEGLYYSILGNRGGAGGNGGQGGNGGTPGKPGALQVVTEDIRQRTAGFQKSAKPGPPGKHGLGGNPGQGGLGGNHHSCYTKGVQPFALWWDDGFPTGSTIREATGGWGRDGVDAAPIDGSDNVPLGFDPEALLNEYKGMFGKQL